MAATVAGLGTYAVTGDAGLAYENAQAGMKVGLVTGGILGATGLGYDMHFRLADKIHEWRGKR